MNVFSIHCIVFILSSMSCLFFNFQSISSFFFPPPCWTVINYNVKLFILIHFICSLVSCYQFVSIISFNVSCNFLWPFQHSWNISLLTVIMFGIHCVHTFWFTNFARHGFFLLFNLKCFNRMATLSIIMVSKYQNN